MVQTLLQKLTILADAAKYDASCASSGGDKRKAGPKGIGSVTGAGICHAYTPDGRCISLLKILLTNFCIYDCLYCVSRRSSNVPRARFTVQEVVTLTLDLYRRNCIEGLFLSSGIARSEDDTLNDLVEVARSLRQDHHFRGYIHLKCIAGASPELYAKAGRYADRLSTNLELASDRALADLAPEKSPVAIKKGLAITQTLISDDREPTMVKSPRRERYAPAGQSTQIIAGADQSRDSEILSTSATAYAAYGLRRVYYSAFSPTGHAAVGLSSKPAPLQREHRLYQADWMLRHYGFALGEIVDAMPNGMLDLEIDPKLAWALGNRGVFPINVNKAPRELLLRIPGLGTRAIDRILAARRDISLRLDDVAKLTSALRRARPFLTAADWQPGPLLDAQSLRQQLARKPLQMELFG